MQKAIAQVPDREALQHVMDAFRKFCVAFVNNADPKDQGSIGLLLLSAMFIGDYSVVRALLENKSNDFGIFGDLAARAVIGTDNLELLELTFQHHPEWFSSDTLIKQNMLYPVEMAAINGQMDMFNFLFPHTTQAQLSRPASRDPIMGPIPPLLFYLMREKRHQIIELILTKKPDLELRTSEDHTALSHACLHDDLKSARLLIAAGANVNVTVNSVRGNAVNQSPEYPHPAIQQMMQRIIGNIGFEFHPLEVAASNGNVMLVYLLLKAGAAVDAGSNLLGTALLFAARADPFTDEVKLSPDYINVVRLLLMYKANVHSTDQMGSTALFEACIAKQVEIAKLLLLAGANRYKTNMKGESVDLLLRELGLEDSHNDAHVRKLKAQQKLEALNRKKLIEFCEASLQRMIREASSAPLILQSPEVLEGNKKKKKKKKKKKTLITSPTVGTDIATNSPETKELLLTQEAEPNKTEYLAFDTIPKTSIPASDDINDKRAEAQSIEPTKHDDQARNNTGNTGKKLEAVNRVENDVLTPSQKLEKQRGDKEPTTKAAKEQSQQSPKAGSTANILTTLTKSIFKSDIPSGGEMQKFPLRVEEIKFIHYYVRLIPDVLNKMFSSDRQQELKKIWAAIHTERLLPATSKNKAGVKSLSLIEMSKLSGVFFKRATHKIKPNTEDTRVYLEAKHVKENDANEIHLELIGPDFSAH